MDDHVELATALSLLLGSCSDIVVCGVADGGREGLRLADSLRPDVILLDLSMPEVDGFEVLRLLHEQHIPSRVLVHSTYLLGSVEDELRANGAWGWLEKGCPADDLVAAIRAAGRERPAS
ncbi:MAG: response regulator transcription factor [Nocardioidaceae bacterium]|nr:response regulator transcription factor [Nocardioidaceae bacterium]NUS52975.1 response regulator transcription factor [Nocardioidaceae bacterium]